MSALIIALGVVILEEVPSTSASTQWNQFINFKVIPETGPRQCVKLPPTL